MNYVSERPARAASAFQPIRPLPATSASFVLRRLFSAGLALGSCVRLMDEASALRLISMIDALDAIGADVRRTAVTDEGRDQVEEEATVAPLVAEMVQAVGLLTDHIDSLSRTGVAAQLPAVHLVGALQSLQQALMYLDEAPCRPEETGRSRQA